MSFYFPQHDIKNLCWIFDNSVIYQTLISFCSIIRNNPGHNFNYYFVIPPNSTIDMSKFNHFLPVGSQIIIKHYKPRHAYLGADGSIQVQFFTIFNL